MTLAHNPTAFLNAHISMMRNMFLTSSISLAVLGYSDKSKLFKEVGVKDVALFILAYSVIYGIKSAMDFHAYLKYLETLNDLQEPYLSQIKKWQGWVSLTYVYVILLIFLAVYFVYKLKNTFYNKYF